MALFARLEGNRVVEVAEFDATLEAFRKRFHPSLVWVEVDHTVREGMTYADGMFFEG